MQWYDPLLIIIALIGLAFIGMSSYHEKRGMMWGLLIILIAAVIKAVIWFAKLV
ncbi:MAG: hypothetical protein AABX26_03290 [Nanoarchaeota archaeon]